MSDGISISDSIAWAKPEDVGMSRDRLARMGERLEADIADGSLPGAVALVARRGRVVHYKAYGRRDPAHPDPMQRDTIFRIYSMTKPITSVAAMMLVEEGRLDLAAPVSQYLPDFARMQVYAGEGRTVPAKRTITIHDLLRHTSGMTLDWGERDTTGPIYQKNDTARRSRTNAEQAALLASLPLACQPGERFVYGRSTDVLGHVIEVITGEPIAEHLRARVLWPLGMMETGFHVPADFAHRIAGGHPIDPDTRAKTSFIDLTENPPLQMAGGGMASTTADYARFLHMILNGGTLDGVRLLSPATLAFMMSDHLAPDVGNNLDILPEGYGFGLGFAVRRGGGIAPFPGSPGDCFWEGIAGTSFWIDPALQLYAILMVQAPGRRERYRRMFRSLVYAAVTS
ncbi:serine hydrolase domain-containing protein [Enterovirga rhinocerotis]|uniref:CubicO group peptidase (Beta-lactamase class C family) n=1 Tax=Enterovirga rhinocerotis TaxID=1339210 RepID=A0A4R7C8J8_9HYPH|nr:serine hydrolase domain-containing protein [Enterovirga rhinocerotis]TDR94701.1 CubicO group peptidase (beta-lactamase class C family) [Enterovirga rhinocerotis]